MRRCFYIQQGAFTKYREQFLTARGAKEIEIPTKCNIWPYLMENKLILYIDKGCILMKMIEENGSQYYLQIYAEGSIIPIACEEENRLFDGYRRFYPIINPVKGILLDHEEYVRLTLNNRDIYNAVMKETSSIMMNFLYMPLLLRNGPAMQRISNLLYMFYLSSYRELLFQFLNQVSITYMTGLSRYHVVRMFTILKEEGVLEIKKGKIKILNVDKLKEKVSVLLKNE